MLDMHRNNGTLIESNFPTHDWAEWEIKGTWACCHENIFPEP